MLWRLGGPPVPAFIIVSAEDCRSKGPAWTETQRREVTGCVDCHKESAAARGRDVRRRCRRWGIPGGWF